MTPRSSVLRLAFLLAIGAPVFVRAQEPPPPEAAPEAEDETRGEAGTAPDAGVEAEVEAEPDVEAESDPEFSDEDLLDEISEEIDAEPTPAPDAAPAETPDEAPVDPDLLTLPEAVVAYTREDAFRTGGGVSLVTQEELETFEYSDPNSVLLRVPGVYVRSEEGFGLRPNIGIRGTRPDRSSGVTLMEDGILFGPAPYSAPAAYYFPLVTRMVGIEVFKGPAAILYGPQTVGGAVNFLTREVPREASGEIDLQYGLYHSRKLHLHYGASNRWGGILFEGVDLYSAGFKDIDFSDAETGFHRSEFMVRGFLQSDPNARIYNRVELKLGYSRELSYETYLGLADEDFRADPYRRYLASSLDRMHWNRYQVELLHRLSVGESFDLFTSLYRHDFHRVWRRADQFVGGVSLFETLTDPESNPVLLDWLRSGRDSANLFERIMLAVNDRRFVSQGVQTNARLRFRTGDVSHSVEVGARFHYDEIDRDHSLLGYFQENHSLVSDGNDPIPTTDQLASTFAFAAHAMYGLDVAGLRLTPGLRVEVIRNRFRDVATQGPTVGEVVEIDGSQVVVLPGLGASYAIVDWLGVFAGVHRGFAPVAPGQPDDVDPELSISTEAGVRVNHEELGITAELVGFYNDYSNMLLTCTGSGGCEATGRQNNAGSANIGGLEFVYGQAIGITDDVAIPVRAAYTYTSARLRDAVEGITAPPEFADAQDGDYVPYVPRHQLSADLGVDWQRLGVRFTGTYLGEMLEQAGEWDEELMTDGYFLLDAVGQYEIFERATVYVRFENITNREPLASRRPFGARPARPFTAQVGLKVEL